jgi:hypothetical protein
LKSPHGEAFCDAVRCAFFLSSAELVGLTGFGVQQV